MSEQREALAAAIHADDWSTPWDETEDRFIPGWGEPIGFTPNEKQSYQEYADAVIAHLWQRADDPEVLGAITTFCWPDRDIEWWSTLNDIDKAGYNSSTRTDVAAVLTALLGPRPSGEESEK